MSAQRLSTAALENEREREMTRELDAISLTRNDDGTSLAKDIEIL